MSKLTSQKENTYGFVVIGRNEGERLKASLNALATLHPSAPVVYVDSGSSDDSVTFAKSLGVQVELLDESIPFTAGRARNLGFHQLISAHPELEFVQFLDGDCELQQGWIESALEFMGENTDVAVVSGRRFEKFPEHSVFNALMDIEWNTPVGQTSAVLGDMCVRVNVFQQVDGFSSNVIAAEDDDLCIRIRDIGYSIYRLDHLMSAHDANLDNVSQWFKRAKRSGYAYANIFHLHGHGQDRYFFRELKSAVFWGGGYPIAICLFLFFKPVIAFLQLILLVFQIGRLFNRRLGMGNSKKLSFAYSVLIYFSKPFEFLGIFEYWKNIFFMHEHKLIEYK